MSDFEDNGDEWNEQIAAKGQRARRRELEAVRESGHLRAWYSRQGWPQTWDNPGLFRQLLRAYRHSCHAACCVIDQWEKHSRNRRTRREARQQLRKRQS